jgi:hypothetical protein
MPFQDFLEGENYAYTRLDGDTPAKKKQEAVDAFNATDSKLFVFLLSTRAGGLGLNLMSADTIIIYDPDFNPHADLQALSRAHRLGQTKKVMVFRLITKGTVEERIYQVGRKKLVIDHLVIEKMGDSSLQADEIDAILRYGAKLLFEENESTENNYRIDSVDSKMIDQLLDEHQNETSSEPTTVEPTSNPFAFERVWHLDRDNKDDEMTEVRADDDFWEQLLAKRALKAMENDAKQYGRIDGRSSRRVARKVYTELDPVPGKVVPLIDAAEVIAIPENSTTDPDWAPASVSEISAASTTDTNVTAVELSASMASFAHEAPPPNVLRAPFQFTYPIPRTAGSLAPKVLTNTLASVTMIAPSSIQQPPGPHERSSMAPQQFIGPVVQQNMGQIAGKRKHVRKASLSEKPLPGSIAYPHRFQEMSIPPLDVGHVALASMHFDPPSSSSTIGLEGSSITTGVQETPKVKSDARPLCFICPSWDHGYLSCPRRKDQRFLELLRLQIAASTELSLSVSLNILIYPDMDSF